MDAYEIMDLVAQMEAGESAAAISLARHFAALDIPRAALVSQIFLERSYFLDAVRLPGSSEEPPSLAALGHMVSSYRQGTTGDCVIGGLLCTNCKPEPDIPMCIFVGKPEYTEFEEFIGHALRIAHVVVAGYIAPCAGCGKRPEPLFVDYLSTAFHEQMQLVVRVFTTGPKVRPTDYALFWFDPDQGYLPGPIVKLDETERCLSALERAVKLRMLGRIDECAAIVEETFVTFKNDPGFIHIAALMQKRQHLGLCQNLARAHIAAYPEDPLGHFSLAESLFRGFLANPKSQSTFKQCVSSLQTALALRPNWKEAELLRCMVARFEELPEPELQQMYESLISRYPDFSNAFFDYGLLLFQSHKERGLSLLKRASELSPSEPAYLQTLESRAGSEQGNT